MDEPTERHRMKEIFEICDDVTVFRDGQFIAERAVSDLSEESLIEMMVSRKLEDQYPNIEQQPGEVRLKVENLSGPGVDNVSFTLRKGEGIFGLMGAGCTELMKVLYGALPRTGGNVMLNGRNINYAFAAGWSGKRHRLYLRRPRARWFSTQHVGVRCKENMSLMALLYFSRTDGSLKYAEEQLGGDFYPPVLFENAVDDAVDWPAFRR